ncbi:hypothetical protein LBMAG42_12370 [Deltaproteobacteria bacterium]|nr:hypothetical protein LBMAG42_12370 [Deltaproteobacteria bacterium]
MSADPQALKWRRIGAVIAAIGVAAGAFGAHALGEHPRLETWKTAAQYELFHGIALCVPGLPFVTRALLLVGTLIFAGSLYLLVLLDQPWLGAITPLGGLALIAGWLSAASALKAPGAP